MTTTTADRTEATENLVDAAAEAADALKAKTLATVRPEQQRWDENQLAILRQLGIEDATQGDLDLFFHYCRTTGLDPFRKQIYMIGRNTKVTEWVDNGEGGRRKVERYVTKYTIQTGIDGYRRNGREAAKRLGDSLSFDGPYWCGEDGEWKEVWPAKTPPVAAKYTVFRNGEPFTAVVHYDEFVQTNAIYEGAGQNRRKVGEEPNSMWDKMPRNQTAKCAEAMAYRRAYPDDFAGLILEDAAQPTVIDQDGNVEQQGAPAKRRPAASGSSLRDRAKNATREDPSEAEVVNEQRDGGDPRPVANGQGGTADQPPKTTMRKALEKRLFRLIGEIDSPEPINRDDRIAIYRHVVGRADIASTDDLDNVEVGRVCDQLYTWQQDGKLEAKVVGIIIAADSAAAEGEEAQS